MACSSSNRKSNRRNTRKKHPCCHRVGIWTLYKGLQAGAPLLFTQHINLGRCFCKCGSNFDICGLFNEAGLFHVCMSTSLPCDVLIRACPISGLSFASPMRKRFLRIYSDLGGIGKHGLSHQCLSVRLHVLSTNIQYERRHVWGTLSDCFFKGAHSR